ncbi:MAG TPA: 1,4-alpha-glucan branching protein GlgB [Candidatus Limnocylindrales bacterium]|nr:1,4-alpha-glucan branching protein GlgB [Candidatus Limnocylindrales bacterium]
MIEDRRSLLSEEDLHWFNEGRHYRLYEKLGSHPATLEGTEGALFAVWAPNAAEVSVIGSFNAWTPGRDALRPRGGSGLWEGFVPGARDGATYKYHVVSRWNGYRVAKADPYALQAETPPRTASVVRDVRHDWSDADWMATRAARNAPDAPWSIYEVHLGSWMRGDGDRMLGYRELAPRLAEHAKANGFTHVELMPVMEHPFYGSWGYQVTGFYAPTSRYGRPEDLMALVDHLHREGIGVILDWVPSHFPGDEHGLVYFDGTHLYEHAEPRQGLHPDWNSYIFNYGRHEVRSFLLSSALFWLDRYHADGLRVDAVASVLYLDYSRREGEWIPNRYGGRENIEAIDFLRQLNTVVYAEHPDVQVIAEESTAWPMVSRPTYVGGLGFGAKWDMGWMHDTLRYLSVDPIHRKYHQGELTFRALYAFTENFVLPLSHDEVVHGKGSLLARMPGDGWQRFANVRLLFAYMYATPGKKLLFMGDELAQWREWHHDRSLDWHLLAEPGHEGVRRLVADLGRLYREEPALHELDWDPAGFRWVDASDSEQSVLSFLRRDRSGLREVLAVFNFTPVARYNYRIGVPRGGRWEEILSSDSREYGGSGHGNLGGADAMPVAAHGHGESVVLTLPPLGAVYLRSVG